MQLWTDYEGVTIDGAFRLQKLLMPEGRSAFYSTVGPNGEPTVLRLIECHFDEEEILARWRCVEALSHPNFLRFERFGQTELDGRPVVYAVFETVDTNLAEVLDQGHLDIKDVAQLASSLVAALDVLHTHGFIHEHIEPRNIFAISGVVKLRGDCIREAPEGEEGRALKQRDVHDLATVLLQALTQRDSVEGIPDSAMPPPFGQIIRNGLDGTWGLDNIRAALGRQFGSNQQPAPTSVSAAPATAAVAEQNVARVAAKPSTRPEPPLPLPLRKEERNAGFAGATAQKNTWSRKDSWGDAQSFSLRSRWIGTSVAALLLLLCTWIVAHAWNEHRHKAAQAAAVSQPASQPAAPSANPVVASPAPQPAAADSPRVTLPASAGSRVDWRVITFTYNRRADAEKKVSDLARSHPELEPVVFTPSGHAPFLVSIGGLMDRDAAHALARRTRSLGLPHDTYAQNYSR
jgi:eukaryotic-like serine/threonine-protein kinase